MILAAGYGTRLKPLTDNTPKPLLMVGNKPMIHHVIECLKSNGIEEVVINLHYLGDMIRENLGNGEKFGVKINYTEEEEILGTGGGIKNAEKYLSGDTFVVMNTDILVKINLHDCYKFHKKTGGIATLILRSADMEKYNNIVVDETSRIIDIAGALGVAGMHRKGTFAGIHIFEPEIFNYLPEGKSSITDCYIKLIKMGIFIAGYFCPMFWRDLGNMDDYIKVNNEIKNGSLVLQ